MVIVFQYIEMLKQTGVVEEIFKENQQLAQVDFMLKEISSEPSSYVSRVASDLQKYPIEHCVAGSSVIHDYNPQLIDQMVGLLTRDNFQLKLVSPSFTVEPDWKSARYYSTPYHVQRIPSDLLGRLVGSTNPELALPIPNPFIPSTYAVNAATSVARPVIIMDDDLVRLWYKQDSIFHVPKAIIRCEIKTFLTFNAVTLITLTRSDVP